MTKTFDKNILRLGQSREPTFFLSASNSSRALSFLVTHVCFYIFHHQAEKGREKETGIKQAEIPDAVLRFFKPFQEMYKNSRYVIYVYITEMRVKLCSRIIETNAGNNANEHCPYNYFLNTFCPIRILLF